MDQIWETLEGTYILLQNVAPNIQARFLYGELNKQIISLVYKFAFIFNKSWSYKDTKALIFLMINYE